MTFFKAFLTGKKNLIQRSWVFPVIDQELLEPAGFPWVLKVINLIIHHIASFRKKDK